MYDMILTLIPYGMVYKQTRLWIHATVDSTVLHSASTPQMNAGYSQNS